MKVYGIYSGCIYEGGGVGDIYLDRAKAFKACQSIVRENQKQHADYYKNRDPEHYKAYMWRKDNKYNNAYWTNSVDCVMIQEFDIID